MAIAGSDEWVTTCLELSCSVSQKLLICHFLLYHSMVSRLFAFCGTVHPLLIPRFCMPSRRANAGLLLCGLAFTTSVEEHLRKICSVCILVNGKVSRFDTGRRLPSRGVSCSLWFSFMSMPMKLLGHCCSCPVVFYTYCPNRNLTATIIMIRAACVSPVSLWPLRLQFFPAIFSCSFAWPLNALHLEFVWFALNIWHGSSVSFHFCFFTQAASKKNSLPLSNR